MLYLDVILILIFVTVCVFLVRSVGARVKHNRRLRHLAMQRMKLLRRLLSHAYVYNYDPELFLRKFQEEVHISRLDSGDVICTHAEQKRLKRLHRLKHDQPIKNQDLLLCILLDKGFTPQELSVVFGMKNINSIYVRYSRIRKMVESERTAPEKRTHSDKEPQFELHPKSIQ